MGFQEDFRAALAVELDVASEDIVDINVTWDDGERWDPTYGDSPNAAPKFEVTATIRGERLTRTVSTEWTFTALLRAVLAIRD